MNPITEAETDYQKVVFLASAMYNKSGRITPQMRGRLKAAKARLDKQKEYAK